MFQKFLKTALAGFFIGLLLGQPLQARVTGTQPSRSTPDAWCVGKSGAEVCVDASGNLIPTTDNDTTLGTSSLGWATIYAEDLSIDDDLTVTDDAAINGVLSFPADSHSVGATTETSPSSTYAVWTSTGGAVTLTGVVLTSGTVAGEVYILRSSTDTITITDEDTDNGSNVQLGATTRALGNGDVIGFIWNGTDWVEMFYHDVSASGFTKIKRDAAPRTNITPEEAGDLIWNSADGELCVSTGTVATSWVQAADQSTACSH